MKQKTDKTQKQIILEYLKDLNDWQLEFKIRSLNTPFGFIGARGDRTVRDMMEAGELDKDWRGKYRIVKHKEVIIGKPLPPKPIFQEYEIEGRRIMRLVS